MTAIDTPFAPAAHVDQWGYLWDDRAADYPAGGWRLCRVVRDATGRLIIRVWSEDVSAGHIDMSEASVAGRPYRPSGKRRRG